MGERLSKPSSKQAAVFRCFNRFTRTSFLASLLFFSVGSSGAAEECVSLQSAHGRYLVAEQNHSVSANRTAVGPWEKWSLIDHDDGTISLQSAHGRYLVAEQGHSVSANRTAVGPWERWQRIPCAPAAEEQIDLGRSSHPEDPPLRYAEFIRLHALPLSGNGVPVRADVALHISGESFDNGAVVSFDFELHGTAGAIDSEGVSVRLASASCTHGRENPVSLERGEALGGDGGRTVTVPIALAFTDTPCPNGDDVDVDIVVRFRRARGGGTSEKYPVSIANVVTTSGGHSIRLTSGGQP